MGMIHLIARLTIFQYCILLEPFSEPGLSIHLFVSTGRRDPCGSMWVFQESVLLREEIQLL